MKNEQIYHFLDIFDSRKVTAYIKHETSIFISRIICNLQAGKWENCLRYSAVFFLQRFRQELTKRSNCMKHSMCCFSLNSYSSRRNSKDVSFVVCYGRIEREQNLSALIVYCSPFVFHYGKRSIKWIIKEASEVFSRITNSRIRLWNTDLNILVEQEHTRFWLYIRRIWYNINFSPRSLW